MFRALAYGLGLLSSLFFLAAIFKLDHIFVYPQRQTKAYDFNRINVPAKDWQLVDIGEGAHTLRGLWVTAGPDPTARKTVLYFNGNYNILDLAPKILAPLFHAWGVNLLAIEYRGYGLSGDFKTTEKSIYEDGINAYNHLKNKLKIPEENIIISGYSLGAAVALNTAQDKAISGVVLWAPFTTIHQVIKDKSIQVLPSRLLFRSKLNNLNKLDHILSNILVIHGNDDVLVHDGHGRKIVERIGEKGRFVSIDGATHGSIFEALSDDNLDVLKAFILKEGV